MMARIAIGLLLLAATGCYTAGFTPAAGLKEVAVPVFTNRTLRREVEHDLTRHVRREVLESTPLQLADEGEARAVLRGAVVFGQGNVASYLYDNSDAAHDLSAHVGTTRKFQYWFRDPNKGPIFFNLSNAIAIDILP